MVIGVPKEIKVEEKRIALVPGERKRLPPGDTRCLLKRARVSGSGFDDEEYVRAGAEIARGPSDL